MSEHPSASILGASVREQEVCKWPTHFVEVRVRLLHKLEDGEELTDEERLDLERISNS